MKKNEPTNNDNIEVIDVDTNINADTRKKGFIDLRFFDKLSKDLTHSAEICTETCEIVREAVYDAVEKAHLNGIDFSLCDMSHFTEGLLQNDNRIRGILMEGEDDKYIYMLVINTDYDDEDDDLWLNDMYDNDEDDDSDVVLIDDEDEELPPIEMPPATFANAFRVSKSDLTNCNLFNFDKDEWEDFNYNEFLGMTDHQINMFLDDEVEESPESELLMLYRDAFGDVSDEEFDKIVNLNKEMLALYEKVFNLADIDILEDKTICLFPYDNIDGTSIIFDNGKYELNAVLNEDIIATSFATPNIDKIQEAFLGIAEKKPFKDTVLIFPLSATAFVFVGKNGTADCFFTKDRTPLERTKKENKILRKYNAAVNEVLNNNEE